MSTALQTLPVDGEQAPLDIIKFAVANGAAVDVIERLMPIRRELEAEAAKREFDAAMAAFQSECPVIVKRKEVKNTSGGGVRYKYAPLDDIVEQVRSLLSRHRFSYTLTTETHGEAIKSICKVTHARGHFETSSFEVPIDPKAFMNQQQKYAAALTYSKRYAFCNAFGILTGDEDTDVRAQRETPKSVRTASPKTREWMIEQFAGMELEAEGYAVARGWIEESLVDWPLEHVPTNKDEMAKLKDDVLKEATL